MQFAAPEWLQALYGLPIVVWFLIHGVRRRRRDLAIFTGSELGAGLAPGRSWRKTLLKSAMTLGGFVLLVMALARPQFGTRLVKVEREGIDLVIALDTSLSMLAEDMKPNRLERAKQEIIDLIRGLHGDRVGLVIFAGDAFVMCPLTVDYNAALMFARSADIDVVSRAGTALEEAIDESAALFDLERGRDRVIILVTDGESHTGHAVEAANKAGEKGIRIYTIGIGNPAGELIPLRGTDGSVSGYKKDASGETVLTRLDEKTLRRIADAGGGKYLPATRAGLELKVLYKEIAGLQKTTIEGEFVERKRDRFAVFLLGSFLLLGFESIMSRKGSIRGQRGRLLHTGFSCVLIALFVAPILRPGAASASGVDRGQVKSGNRYYESKEYRKALLLYREALGDTVNVPRLGEGVLYNQANALHMMGRYEEALGKYNQSVSGDSINVGETLYNRGNTLLKMGKPGEATESYLQALRVLPDDEDARHNLELALRAAQQQKQQQQQNPQPDENRNSREKNDSEQGNNSKEPSSQGDRNRQDGEEDQPDEPGREPPHPDSSGVRPTEPPDSSAAAQPQSIQLSREDALRILKLLEEHEKELQKARRKAAFKRRSRSGKDW